MSSKKLSSVKLALCFCDACSEIPEMRKVQDGAQDVTIQQHYMTDPPLAILNARRTDERLSIVGVPSAEWRRHWFY
jgi:hypothetical protein